MLLYLAFFLSTANDFFSSRRDVVVALVVLWWCPCCLPAFVFGWKLIILSGFFFFFFLRWDEVWEWEALMRKPFSQRSMDFCLLSFLRKAEIKLSFFGPVLPNNTNWDFFGVRSDTHKHQGCNNRVNAEKPVTLCSLFTSRLAWWTFQNLSVFLRSQGGSQSSVKRSFAAKDLFLNHSWTHESSLDLKLAFALPPHVPQRLMGVGVFFLSWNKWCC